MLILKPLIFQTLLSLFIFSFVFFFFNKSKLYKLFQYCAENRPIMEPKIALVTGCSSGIGEACVIQLVKEGMTVVGVARRLDRLESLAEILQKEVGEFHYRQVDFRVESEIIELYQFIKKKFGGLDFVVNNAGTGCKSSLIGK